MTDPPGPRPENSRVAIIMPMPVASVAQRSEVSRRTASSSAAVPMIARIRPSGNHPTVNVCAIVPASP